MTSMGGLTAGTASYICYPELMFLRGHGNGRVDMEAEGADKTLVLLIEPAGRSE